MANYFINVTDNGNGSFSISTGVLRAPSTVASGGTDLTQTSQFAGVASSNTWLTLATRCSVRLRCAWTTGRRMANSNGLKGPLPGTAAMLSGTIKPRPSRKAGAPQPKVPAAGGSGIHINPAHKGLLHEKLGVPQGQPIPSGKLDSALNSPSPSLRKEANFAKNAKSW